MFYFIDSSVWLRIILLLITVVVLLYSFNAVMSSLLKVEKRSFFRYSHMINERHKRMDRIIRVTFILILLICFIYNVTGDPTEKVWFFGIGFVIVLSVIISEIVRAIMEWKYEENRKAYMLTISNLIFAVIMYGFIIFTFK